MSDPQTFTGGPGNDTYTVDNSADQIIEQPNGGIDTVNASVSYVLPANVEILNLTGTADLTGTGNELDNTITANSGNDVLNGMAGDDTLIAGAGADTLNGGDGNDLMIAGTGTAAFDGGNGIDTVSFENATSSVVVYLNGGGVNGQAATGDTITNTENLVGSKFTDVLHGDSGDNAIYGLAGNDQLDGGAGNDHLDGGTGDDILLGGLGNDTLIGGDGNDVLIGGPGTDTLTGGTGYDTFEGKTADLTGDTITDLSAGDSIVIDDATLSGFTYSISGNTLSFSGGGSLTLTNVPAERIIVSAAAGGGVQLTVAKPVHNDFNGDGHSDILWRHDSGYLTDWVSNSDGSFTPNEVNAGTGAADNSWQVVGTGDFNGDGRADILWRNTTTGFVTDWLGTSSGGFTDNSVHAGNGSANTNWAVAGVGDFNGDGISDILWRNPSNGYVTEWLGNTSGGFVSNEAHAGTGIANTSWTVAGTGDFNGDGISDILWRNTSGFVTEWLGTSSGGFIDNSAHAGTGVADNSWQIAGTGDFNGDGMSDILWRNASSGYITEWLGTSSGAFTDNSVNAGTGLANTSWHIVGIGNYNGDGKDDILWRNDSGYVTEWLGSATGAFIDNSAHAGTGLANNTFHVEDPFL